MKIELNENFSHFTAGDGPEMYVTVVLEHTDLEHVFVGLHGACRVFEAKLPKGQGLEANTHTFNEWLADTRFRKFQ